MTYINKNNLSVSFVMSIYNGEKYLDESIDSILSQTYNNFNLIIVDDASTDKTLLKLTNKAKTDSRIIILSNKINQGLTKSLIKAINYSSSDIIVRQDVDEVSNPNRLEILLNFYEEKTIVAVGSLCENIYSKELRSTWKFLDEEQIKQVIKYKTIFAHGSSSFRRLNYINVNGYDTKYITCQDFDLWNKLNRMGRIIMSDQVLLKRYILNESISNRRKFRQFYDALNIRIKYRNSIFNPKIYYYSFISLFISFIPKKIYFFIKN